VEAVGVEPPLGAGLAVGAEVVEAANGGGGFEEAADVVDVGEVDGCAEALALEFAGDVGVSAEAGGVEARAEEAVGALVDVKVEGVRCKDRAADGGVVPQDFGRRALLAVQRVRGSRLGKVVGVEARKGQPESHGGEADGGVVRLEEAEEGVVR